MKIENHINTKVEIEDSKKGDSSSKDHIRVDKSTFFGVYLEVANPKGVAQILEELTWRKTL